jgi:hypothetical protein
MVTHAFSAGRRTIIGMFHRLRRGALVFVVAGIGYAVLYRRDRTSPLPNTGGWVDLPFDGQRP